MSGQRQNAIKLARFDKVTQRAQNQLVQGTFASLSLASSLPPYRLRSVAAKIESYQPTLATSFSAYYSNQYYLFPPARAAFSIVRSYLFLVYRFVSRIRRRYPQYLLSRQKSSRPRIVSSLVGSLGIYKRALQRAAPRPIRLIIVGDYYNCL